MTSLTPINHKGVPNHEHLIPFRTDSESYWCCCAVLSRRNALFSLQVLVLAAWYVVWVGISLCYLTHTVRT